jgi:hypothetical protein
MTERKIYDTKFELLESSDMRQVKEYRVKLNDADGETSTYNITYYHNDIGNRVVEIKIWQLPTQKLALGGNSIDINSELGDAIIEYIDNQEDRNELKSFLKEYDIGLDDADDGSWQGR